MIKVKEKQRIYKNYFIAYSSKPTLIGQTINEFIGKINKRGKHKVSSWQQMDIPGQFIRDKILENIKNCDVFVADVSVDNFNVLFEIGYAIGIDKPIILIKNSSLNSKNRIIELGVYDTIGYVEYENSRDLLSKIPMFKPKPLLSNLRSSVNRTSPVYLVDTKHKTEYATRVTARVKKERLKYRSFDPNEMTRLSANEAISNVSQSIGVVVQLLHEDIEDFELHNYRASFIAGLSTGMNKKTKILQFSKGPIPLDYRDFTDTYQSLQQIDEIIIDFARGVYEELQTEDDDFHIELKESLLKKLDFGSGSAENEIASLSEYYLKTDEFYKASRGEVQLVVGRKGSGKSAVFLQLRDKERNRNQNVVLDLKPEGFILLKFKERVLDFMEEGTRQHTITSIWEYLLLLEVGLKILKSDKDIHRTNTTLFKPYRDLEDTFNLEKYNKGSDFSERMNNLLKRISINYKNFKDDSNQSKLNQSEISKLLHIHDIKKLRELIFKYLKHKKELWILFDNIDKGWPTNGVTSDDIIIIRTLIDACSRLKRSFNKQAISMHSLVFLRNDVFELLVENTADKGKESKVILDWTDKDLLKEIIRLRALPIIRNQEESSEIIDKVSFDELWSKICVNKYKGMKSIDFILDQCLMRPRFLINLLNHCKACSMNLGHEVIQSEDIDKAMHSFSSDLLVDVSYEVKDVFPDATDILYAFVGSESKLSILDINELLSSHLTSDKSHEVLNVLLWYGFLGVKIKNETKYIYDLNYNMQLIRAHIRNQKDKVEYHINSAFWPALMIDC